MLPDDDGVFIEIAYVGTANSLRVLLHHHPTEVAIEESLSHGVRIFIGVGVAVMSTVVTGP